MSRRFQFSLRALLVATTLIGAGLATLLTQLRAVESIHALEGICWCDLGDGYPSHPESIEAKHKWRRRFAGVLYPVVEVEIPPMRKTFDERREAMRGAGGGVMWLGPVRNSGRDFNDDDLAGCLRFPKLKRLDISFSNVSDAGVASLTKMRSLEYLSLAGTRITPAGIQRLKQNLPQCNISD
jgi:hypothetical protein